MNILGELIKEKRLQSGVTQKNLAKDICTQATISNLESKSRLPSITTLIYIADRLNIDFNELFISILNSFGHTIICFQEIRQLCVEKRYEEAQHLLVNDIDFDKLKIDKEIKQYYYYLALTTLYVNESFEDARYYFNLVLMNKIENKLDQFDILATNGIGISYEFELALDKAITYYEKVLIYHDEIVKDVNTIINTEDIVNIFLNSSEFFSKMEMHEKSLVFCDLGIRNQKKVFSYVGLDKLYYQKAFNFSKIGRVDESKEYYFYAVSFAKLNSNNIILGNIKRDLKELKIEEYNYLLL